jgi:hypothetical protein
MTEGNGVVRESSSRKVLVKKKLVPFWARRDCESLTSRKRDRRPKANSPGRGRISSTLSHCRVVN